MARAFSAVTALIQLPLTHPVQPPSLTFVIGRWLAQQAQTRATLWRAVGVGIVLASLGALAWNGVQRLSIWPSQTIGYAQQQPLMQSTATLVSQTLHDKQTLLETYAKTLLNVDLSDALIAKTWANTHGDLVARFFEESWLIRLPQSVHTSPNFSASSTAEWSAWSLQAGKATTPQTLPPTLTAALASHLHANQVSGMELLLLPELKTPRVLYFSAVLNPQGQPIAALVGLTPLSIYLPVELSPLALRPAQASTKDAAATGFFIINAAGTVVADSTDATGALFTTRPGFTDWSGSIATRFEKTADYALYLQAIPNTPWWLGLSLPLSPKASPLPSPSDDDPLTNGLLVGLSAAGFLLALLAGFWFFKRSPNPALQSKKAPDAQTLAHIPQVSSSRTFLHQLGQRLGWGRASKHLSNASKNPSTQHASGYFSGLASLENSSQCLVLIRHGQIKAMSQGALDFLQLTPQAIRSLSVRRLLVYPNDYERLRVMQHTALRQSHHFTFTTTIRDAHDARHTVWVQTWAVNTATTAHNSSHLVACFEPVHAKLARLAPTWDTCTTPLQLDPVTCLPTFTNWRALLLKLLQSQAQPQASLASHAPSIHQTGAASGFIFYLNIDGFSVLLNEGGPASSNEALRYVANALTHALGDLRATSVLGYLQRDTFAFACLGLNETEALALAKQIQSAISNLQASYQGIPMALSVSLGLAALPNNPSHLDAQLHAADLACFDATSKGVAGITVAPAS